ncbi:myb-related protein Hv33-like [Iris pallida]|uniref:Myb-related protein Hv33-like n=1 Tax=Iris pallida TaxID=29817 RepID=A0AAX6F1H9_IRIPA|nr:myb-related protein Hv33-like [Iris pallida]
MGIDPNTHKPLNDHHYHRQEEEKEKEKERHRSDTAPSKPPAFNPFPGLEFNPIGSVGMNWDFDPSFLVPGLEFCDYVGDDNNATPTPTSTTSLSASVSYAGGNGEITTPSNCSNLSTTAQKSAGGADEYYASFQSMMTSASALDEMLFDISAGEVELDLDGDFF